MGFRCICKEIREVVARIRVFIKLEGYGYTNHDCTRLVDAIGDRFAKW